VPEAEGMRSVRTALRVLEAVADHQPAGVGELSRILGLPKSSVQRALQTLGAAGWIRPAPGEVTRWVLTSRARRLGRLAGEEDSIREAAMAAMERLRADTGETVHLMVPDGPRAVLIERLETANPVRIVLPLGSSVPLHGSANGKAILAGLPAAQAKAVLDGELPRYTDHTIVGWADLEAELAEIRRRGYATNYAEWRADIAAAAAAILGPDGQPIASLSVSTPISRMSPDLARRYGALVSAEAHQVSTALGYDRPPPTGRPGSHPIDAGLPALPAGRPFLHEGLHALVEVLAAVTGGYEVIAVRQPRVSQPADRLLTRPHGERRMTAQLFAEFQQPGVQILFRHHLGHQAGRERVGGRQERGRIDDVQRARRSDQVDQAGVGPHRQAVAQRPGDRQAELRVRRADAYVADRGQGQAAADRITLHGRDRGHPDSLQPVQDLLGPALVGQAVLSGRKLAELPDVRAGYERLTTRAAQHGHPDLFVGVDALARLD
jgi:DNA-binding IclR family transcriptional regulator